MKAGSMVNEKLDRRLRRGARAAIVAALLAFCLFAAGCFGGTDPCPGHYYIVCPPGQDCYKECI